MDKQQSAFLSAGIAHVVIIFFGILMIYPVAWLFFASFTEDAAIFSDTRLIPRNWIMSNYVEGWRGLGFVTFGTFFANSFMLAGLSVLLNVIFCSLTAYAFARLNFPGRKIWFAIMLITMMLPGQVTTIPRYVIFVNFGWLDTQLPMLVPRLFAQEAFFIFLLVQFIRGIPKELDESAHIDGYGKLGIYLRIIIPLSVPALVTTMLFSFLWSWDDFFNQLLYLVSPRNLTVPLGLRMFVEADGIASWGAMFAMSVLSLVPSFILFFTLQKYFVQGISTTGIKG